MAENEVPNKFDTAAETAEKDLVSLLEQMDDTEKKGAMAVIKWQAANYMKAGHKRLGRILVTVSNQKASGS